MMAIMDGRIPLPTLLSHALVAFVVEFDNEFEHRAPHRTALYGSTGGPFAPWLLSMVMWARYLQFVDLDGMTVGELQRRSGIPNQEMSQWLKRMSRGWWGYVTVEGDARGAERKRLSPDAIVRPTPGGRKALEVWTPLASVIEKRWQDRFGSAEVNRLLQALAAVAGQVATDLPDSLPILNYGLFSWPGPARPTVTAAAEKSPADPSLPALLSRVLLAFAVEFEHESSVSLAICANVLRVVAEPGTRIANFPRLAGVSKESIAMATGYLAAHGYGVVEPESPASKKKVLRLTAKGWQAREAYFEILPEIETRWQARLGSAAVAELRVSLEALNGPSEGPGSPLFRGLDPYPDGWRAKLPRPLCLPDFPMILHRGGYPDGS
jgi:DNA-binding MarR family transcriptional regulator